MNWNEFEILLASVQATFPGTKPFSTDSKHRWFEKVRDVSSSHCVEITKRIEDMDRLPGNLGKAILDIAGVLAPAQGEDAGKWHNTCPECDPGRWKGQIVYFTRLTDGRIAKHFTDCALCRPASANKSTRRELAAIGVMVPPTPNDVGAWYFRMFMANNPGATSGSGHDFSGMLGDKKRAALAAAETLDEQGVDTGARHAA